MLPAAAMEAKKTSSLSIIETKGHLFSHLKPTAIA
jgi:hypothetical protein